MKLSSAALAAVLSLSCAAVRADTFFLSNGGQVDGSLQNATENPRTKYVIRTSNSGDLVLDRNQVKEIRPVKPEEIDYVRFRPQYRDTPEGQMGLADWCRNHRLEAQKVRHLKRVIELDPDHQKARAALGYTRVDGEWKTRDEIFESRGMIKDKSGTYRVPQQIEERERKRAQDKTEKEWFAKIRRWRDWLDGDRSEEARAQFQKINDPAAVPALAKHMQKEPDSSVRKMYVDAMARTASPDAWQVLTVKALDDPDEEIRLTCLDYLEKLPNTGAVPTFIRRMQKTTDNAMVNRAGVALGRMKDASAIRPLIDSLVTKHDFEIPTSGAGMNSTFGSGPGGASPGGFSFGGGGPKYETRILQNPAVRDALTSLTGVNFDYDQQAWKNWFSSQKKTRTVDARRD